MDGLQKNGNTIQSIERALRVLEEFSARERELGVTELAKRLGLNKSTCFGILHTLQSNGYLEQNPDTGKYCLGLKLFELGQTYEAGLELRNIAKPYLENLSEKTKETVHLVVRNGMDAVYIEKVEGPSAINIISQVGKRVNLHCTGVGKSLLAFLPREQLERVLQHSKLKQFTEYTITDKEKLLDELERIREKGYSIDNEEIELGLRCVAAPLFNHRNEVIGAISIAGPTMRLTLGMIEELADLVKEAALQISQRLGYHEELQKRGLGFA